MRSETSRGLEMFPHGRCAFTAKRACSAGHVKPENGYRHYEPRQLAQLTRSKCSRDGTLLERYVSCSLDDGPPRNCGKYSRKTQCTPKKDAGRLGAAAWIDARMSALEGHGNGDSSKVQLRQTDPCGLFAAGENPSL